MNDPVRRPDGRPRPLRPRREDAPELLVQPPNEAHEDHAVVHVNPVVARIREMDIQKRLEIGDMQMRIQREMEMQMQFTMRYGGVPPHMTAQLIEMRNTLGALYMQYNQIQEMARVHGA